MDQEELEKMKQLEALKKIVLQRVLSKAAKERLGRIKLVKPELALQLELYLVQLYQAGKIKNALTEEQLKAVLEALTEKSEFKIIK